MIVTTALRILTLLLAVSAAANAHAALPCGDVDHNNSVTAGDALRALKVSVGSGTCELCVCDVNGSGSISASDAQAVLRSAVGQSVALNCPACANTCGSSAAPTCGGSCGPGLVCAADPENPAGCDCFTACELDSAPACDASCAGEPTPGTVCTTVHISDGSETVDRCICLPPGAKSCASSAAPSCGGLCQPGHACVNDGGTCACEQLAVQVGCLDAEAPLCAGTCGRDKICVASGDACTCVADAGGGDSACRGSQPDQCGAACPDRQYCSKDFLTECSCLQPCQISNAPACGGACTEGETTCTHLTATVGSSTVDFCDCR